MADQPSNKNEHDGRWMYLRYAGMIATAGVLMYIFTYFNTFAWNHIYFSEERVFVTLTMTAMMAVVMLSFMLPMLSNWRVNLAIYAGSVVLFLVALWLLRSQMTVQDVAYMKAMIPHHSIAILTSERAEISDPRVQVLTGQAPAEHGGHKVVRIDPATQQVETFFTKTHGDGGHGVRRSSSQDGSSKHAQGAAGHGGHGSQMESFTAGPRRLLDVRFSSDGQALYIADFGAMKVTDEAIPVPKTGVIWRVVPANTEDAVPPAGLAAPQ